MLRSNARVHPVLRALGVFGAVASLVTGVTYAALSSRASLVNNTISSATVGLEVKSTGEFAAQDAGFAFSGVVPGGPAVPAEGYNFQLKNSGGADLAVAVSVPTAPTFSGGTVDLSQVDLITACETADGRAFGAMSSLNDLVTAHATGGVSMTPDVLPHTGDTIADCTVSLQMDADAVTGSEAVTSGFFNIVFHGTVATVDAD